MTHVRNWRHVAGLALLAGAGCEAIILGFAAADPTYPVDDAYISFSYARTLADGAGLRLMPGVEAVEGFSNPLWVAMLALAGRGHLSIPIAALILSAAAASATAIAVYATARRLVEEIWAPLLATWAFVLAPGLGFHIASGLETIVAGLALLLGFRFLVAAEPPAMGTRAALAVLALALLRPEGAVVFIVWAVLHLRARPELWNRLLVFVLPFSAYVCFRWAYFGQAVPNTVIAKSGVDLFTTFSFGQEYLLNFLGMNAPVIGVAVLGLVSVPARVAVAAVLPLTAMVSMSLMGAHQEQYPFQRYLFAALPMTMVFAARGAAVIVQSGRRHGTVASALAITTVIALAGAQALIRAASDGLCCVPLRAAEATVYRLLAGDRAPHDVDVPPYHRLSRWLRESARPGQLIAMQEIGITSFYSGLRVLDTYGLADQRIAASPGVPSGKVAPDYVFDRAPDYFAIRLAADGIRPGLLGDDVYATDVRLAHEYSLARFFPAAGPPLVAMFTRRPHMVSVESLVATIPASARSAGPAPLHLGALLPTLEPETASFAATGRLHFKRWIDGIRWNSEDPEGGTTLAVDVPTTGLSYFEATIAPPPDERSGEFVLAVIPPKGVVSDVIRLSDTTDAVFLPQDVSVDLSGWRGRRVGLRLLYRAKRAEQMTPPEWLLWMEPRLVVFRGTASRLDTPE